MHDTALACGALFFEYYFEPGQVVLEVGSCNVNGALRSVCPSDAAYIGLDVECGPGVDVVYCAGETFPFRDNAFDIVVCSSVLEHDAQFWETFVEMARVLKPGGALYINAPSNGVYHRLPCDCWRFYPGCGFAFEKLAAKSGYPLILLESFVGWRQSDIWNDFVAIFRKSGRDDSKAVNFLSNTIPSMNVWRIGHAEIIASSVMPEDFMRIAALQDEVARLRKKINETEVLLENLRELLKHA